MARTMTPRPPALAEMQRLVGRFVDGYVREVGAAANRHGLTAAQTRALLLLAEPLPMRTLAERLYCDASNVTGIVDRLESRGLVRRQPDEADRRIKNVTATPAGLDIAGQVFGELHRTRQALEALTPEERVSLRDVLERLIPILDAG
jgi:DNA-binding MarR family transcriptional regulator